MVIKKNLYFLKSYVHYGYVLTYIIFLTTEAFVVPVDKLSEMCVLIYECVKVIELEADIL